MGKHFLKRIFLGSVFSTLVIFLVLMTFNNVSLREIISDSWPSYENRSEIRKMHFGVRTSSTHSSSSKMTTMAVARSQQRGNQGLLSINNKPKTNTSKKEVLHSYTPGDSSIVSRFQDRLNHFKRMCEKPEYKSLRNKSYNSYNLSLGSLRTCLIQKVGSSFTRGLKKGLEKTKTLDKRPPTHYYVFVREPYSRLLSGYLGKILTHQIWWNNIGKYIVTKFRSDSSNVHESVTCGHDVSFPEFIKYVIHAQETKSHRNGHFTPLYDHCGFCSQRYDFIGHLETIKDDLAYILKLANITANVSFNNEEGTMRNKAETIVKQRKEITKCVDMCTALEKVWWSFQARGYIATNISLPISQKDCNTISPTQFADVSWAAHLQSTGKIDKRKQKRDALVHLFLQVPLEDRLKLKRVYMKDFELFGYDPQPPDIFPELVKET